MRDFAINKRETVNIWDREKVWICEKFFSCFKIENATQRKEKEFCFKEYRLNRFEIREKI